MNKKQPSPRGRPKKTTAVSMVRSSAAEYLTFLAASGAGGVEAVYADENVWLTQKIMGLLEYLLGLTHADIVRSQHSDAWWGPVGSFSWRGRDYGYAYLPARMEKEFKSEGGAWGPLQGGLFNGSVEQATTAMAKFHAHLARLQYF